MSVFSLQIQCEPDRRQVTFQWFGESAIRAEGSVVLSMDEQKTAAAPFDPTDDNREIVASVFSCTEVMTIDLKPLLEEIAQGNIASDTDLILADEFLLLRDVLSADDLATLGKTLYVFLWQAVQKGVQFGIQKGIDAKAWADPDRRIVRVWFGTDRKPLGGVHGKLQFSDAESADQITYGMCNVFIPKSHKPGSVGSPWWRRWLLLEADDRLKITSTHTLSDDWFITDLQNKLQTWWPKNQRNLFVYIHGFNVSFDEAAIRAAQIGYDLKLPGEMAFYSWPSRGMIKDYPADEAAIEDSVPLIARFLHTLSEQAGADRIHLFVHSMGNRGVLHAFQELVADHLPDLSLGQIFFCSPDIRIKTFKRLATKYPHQSDHRTVLTSPDDRAVFASEYLHRDERVGHVPPITVMDDADTIVVDGFGLLSLGHGYFASVKPVIDDLRQAIETGQPACQRTIPQARDDHFLIDIREHD